MLKKLLKYDLKWVLKVLSIFYALAIIFAMGGRLMLEVDNSLLFKVLGGITLGLSAGMLIGCIINTFLRSWARFVKNVYKDESYLTHTLPVLKKTIYNAKLISAIIATLLTGIVIILCLFIAYYSENNMMQLKNWLEISLGSAASIKIIILTSINLFLEVIYIIVLGYAAIIIGHKSNGRKFLKSVVYGFGMYSLTQVCSLIFLFIAGWINSDIMKLINSASMPQLNVVYYVLYFSLALYLLFIIFYYFLGKKILEKGVNVD